MHTWRRCAIGILLLSLAAGCATWTSPSAIKWPVPPAIEDVAFDHTTQGGRVYLSMPHEAEIAPAVIWSAAAWEVMAAHLARVVQGYCEGRETLQLANGARPDPAPICRESAGAPEPPAGAALGVAR